ncbi:MAG: hypothetical protein M3O15_03030 [Acidobacteriota bacterium]|nr:hypothetical protein [Acidobacteriota bacterium]
MDPEIRRAFNSSWTPLRYQSQLRYLEEAAGFPIAFRVCETPIFLPAELNALLVEASQDILAQVTSEQYLRRSESAVPAAHRVPGQDAHPVFLQIDFALARAADGGIVPQLIELQGFPSLYGFQWLLDRAYRASYDIAPSSTPYYSGLDAAGYVDCLRRVIVGDADPANVVLLEIDPDRQKTRVDFAATEQITGVRAVDVSAVEERGGRLFYRADAAGGGGPHGSTRSLGGRLTPIHRIYNRVIFDEAERRGVELDRLFRRELDVIWVGHPNWFWKISKFSLPFLSGRFAPQAFFLSALDELPEDLGNYVLKPLYSFAGHGVEVEVTAERLRRLRETARPEDYILQRKVEYAAAIATPDGPAKAEVRMMFVWLDRPMLINNLVRTTKGAMIGVDFNRDKTWIGASVAYHPPDPPSPPAPRETPENS